MNLSMYCSLSSTSWVLFYIAKIVVVHDGRILEKPADEEEVRRNIAGYSVSWKSTRFAFAAQILLVTVCDLTLPCIARFAITESVITLC